MTQQALVQIAPSEKTHARLGFGGWSFGPRQWTGQEDANLLGAMETALEKGITHFDTAADYGDGYSEQLIGRFMAADPARRDRIFLASKANLDDITAQSMIAAIDASRARLQTDMIDLFYIHWPRTGQDMRPVMEGLETARQRGKIRAVGVSNFSVEQMDHISEVSMNAISFLTASNTILPSSRIARLCMASCRGGFRASSICRKGTSGGLFCCSGQMSGRMSSLGSKN
jgi:aryl-alcohol dehydrogenase-like predicted oxidoreductase